MIEKSSDFQFATFTRTDTLEFRDDKDGLNEQEFNEFLRELPQSYRNRFKAQGRDFSEMAGPDGIMDYREFRDMIDGFAEAEARSGGSQ